MENIVRLIFMSIFVHLLRQDLFMKDSKKNSQLTICSNMMIFTVTSFLGKNAVNFENKIWKKILKKKRNSFIVLNAITIRD